jgi:hypothetical protein
MVLPNFPVSFSELPDQFHQGVFNHFQASKSTFFLFLVLDCKAITIPHEQLDLIPPFIDEDENISTHQVEWNKVSSLEGK